MIPKAVLNYLAHGRLRTVPLHTTLVSLMLRERVSCMNGAECAFLGDLNETLAFLFTLTFP